MAKTETTTGMKVDVSVLEKVYETGRKCAAGFKESMKIVFDNMLPKCVTVGEKPWRGSAEERSAGASDVTTRLPHCRRPTSPYPWVIGGGGRREGGSSPCLSPRSCSDASVGRESLP